MSKGTRGNYARRCLSVYPDVFRRTPVWGYQYEWTS
jgi:hypothetical protein